MSRYGKGPRELDGVKEALAQRAKFNGQVLEDDDSLWPPQKVGKSWEAINSRVKKTHGDYSDDDAAKMTNYLEDMRGEADKWKHAPDRDKLHELVGYLGDGRVNSAGPDARDMDSELLDTYYESSDPEELHRTDLFMDQMQDVDRKRKGLPPGDWDKEHGEWHSDEPNVREAIKRRNQLSNRDPQSMKAADELMFRGIKKRNDEQPPIKTKDPADDRVSPSQAMSKIQDLNKNSSTGKSMLQKHLEGKQRGPNADLSGFLNDTEQKVLDWTFEKGTPERAKIEAEIMKGRQEHRPWGSQRVGETQTPEMERFLQNLAEFDYEGDLSDGSQSQPLMNDKMLDDNFKEVHRPKGYSKPREDAIEGSSSLKGMGGLFKRALEVEEERKAKEKAKKKPKRKPRAAEPGDSADLNVT